MPKKLVYAVAGALLALGAPLGLVVVRTLVGGDVNAASLQRDVLLNLPTYAYVAVSTFVAFACFGGVLGAQADSLRRASRVDHLTGLPNRRALEERIGEECARAVRHRAPLSFLLLDVDGLKGINDSGGHGAGDEALRGVAAVILGATRIDDLSARWGGDEFAILAPRTDADQAFILAERIRHGAAGRKKGEPTVSIGVTTVPADAATASSRSLFTRADAALYRAKAAGRNRVVAGPV
ncbi:MAG: GGDEF domain-containing protein [Vicinamibacteria bacterium]